MRALKTVLISTVKIQIDRQTNASFLFTMGFLSNDPNSLIFPLRIGFHNDFFFEMNFAGFSVN